VGLAGRNLSGLVALVTGGASGIGLATGRRLAELGMRVVVADVDGEAGSAAAAALGGSFVRCDVTAPQDSAGAVAHCIATYGDLHLAVLNAGVQGGGEIGAAFDPARYRTVMAVNADGVAFGLSAALPELERRAGTAVAISSLAGLTGVPEDPVYAMSKHAVVGLVRSVGPGCAERGVTVNAVCPGFADTALVEPFRPVLLARGLPLIDPDDVASGVIAAATSEGSGECWVVQVGREPLPYGFRGLPGPRAMVR
jgi:NAD(P)-dependent dehydrogenase (short-subunit alcohol dehydrogenase family)